MSSSDPTLPPRWRIAPALSDDATSTYAERFAALADATRVAELDGRVIGWTAVAPVTGPARGRGVGRSLLHRQVTEADASGDLWTLPTSIFPENRASMALDHAAGYHTLAVRSRIARLDGAWRDTMLLERRRDRD